MSTVTRSSSLRRQPQRTAKNPPPPPPKKVSLPQIKKPVARVQSKPSTSNKNGNSRNLRSNNERRRPLVNDDATKNKVTHRFIQLGERCQVTMPKEGPHQGPSHSPEREVCVWKMDGSEMKAEELEEFCCDTYEKYGLPCERAMYALYNNDFDKKKAMVQAEESALLQEQWSDNDCFAFNGLFATYGKDFRKIHKMMSYKSMRSLIEHYYKVKMVSYKVGGLIEATKQPNVPALNGFEEEDDEYDLDKTESVCDNCGATAILHQINNEMQCLSCKRFFEEFNYNRPVDRSDKRALLKYDEEAQILADKFTQIFFNAPVDKSRPSFVNMRGKRQADAREIKMKSAQQEQASLRAVKHLAVTLELQAQKKYMNKKKHKPKPIDAWNKTEQKIAIGLLVRYSGNCEKTARILGTKTVENVEALYKKYESCIKEEVEKIKKQVDLESDVNAMYKTITQKTPPVDVVDLD
ncbi:unnamed protein product [Bursaphelenchus okinawaensis]|uniref:SANT domain-containing protein n=1 Tax=Bursaphelenchus okinawaensis TaxID=465554 RepID=A0A811L876_9BILA|nr:unnamed protein product [Bursaphelenchus okinawaensis]CAG9118635.1 unnamed protein product [Bursaphelenchus okinawaensis]